jgi:hypothetical protein
LRVVTARTTGLQRGHQCIVGEFARSSWQLPDDRAVRDRVSADVRTLQDRSSATDTELRVDPKRAHAAGDVQVKVSIPPNARDALITGAWDTTGLLLDRYDEVDAASARLPYVSGF